MSILPFKKILVPTDFSDPARNALACAAEMAEHFGAKLHILHVMAPIPLYQPGGLAGDGPGATEIPLAAIDIKKYEDQLLESNHQKLKELAQTSLPKNLEHFEIVIIGDPGVDIPRFAEENQIDLIVISTHGLTGIKRLLMGSVTAKVVRLATMPVTVVRHQDQQG